MIRVLVTGGRRYYNYPAVRDALDAVISIVPMAALIQGGATGADTLAKEWARLNNFRDTEVKANWDKFGDAAGGIRNGEMLREHFPDLVIAFPGGPGTQNMRRQARKKGVTVINMANGQDAGLQEIRQFCQWFATQNRARVSA